MALLTRREARLLLPLGTALALSLAGDLTMYAVLPNQYAVLGASLAGVGLPGNDFCHVDKYKTGYPDASPGYAPVYSVLVPVVLPTQEKSNHRR